MTLPLRWERSEVLDYEAIADKQGDSTLTEIMHLVDMPSGVAYAGWNGETARLFALDAAMTAIRRNLVYMSETDKHSLVTRLHEARSLVVSGRDSELGFIQASLESNLATASPERERRIWLTAIDALIPSPFRAALVSTKNALTLAIPGIPDLASLIRGRLLARLGEGSLLSENLDQRSA